MKNLCPELDRWENEGGALGLAEQATFPATPHDKKGGGEIRQLVLQEASSACSELE